MRSSALAGLGAALLALAPLGARAQATQDPAARLEALAARYDAAQQEYMKARRAAQNEAEVAAAMAKRPDAREYAPLFLEIAEAAGADETGASAWTWVVRLAPEAGDAEMMGVAVDAILRDHADAPSAVGLPTSLRYASRSLGAEVVEELLARVVDSASIGELQAAGLLNLAQVLAEDAEGGSERQQKARKLFDRLVAEYEGLEDSRGRAYTQMAESWIFEMDHLQVGMTAPEIEAADLNGVTFKLSDYRGKVVLLDFWGNW